MIKYEGDISNSDSFRTHFRAAVFWGALQFRCDYEEFLDGGLYLFGHRIRTLKQIYDWILKPAETEADICDGNTECPAEDIAEAGNESAAESADPGHDMNDADIQTAKERRIDRIRRRLKNDRAMIKAFKESIKTIAGFLSKRILPWIKETDSELRKAALSSTKGILHQIMPRRIKGDFRFGFGEPDYTGQLMGIFAVLYGFMGDDLKVEPVWEDFCFEGKAEFTGKIHISVIQWHLLKLGVRRDFIKFWREYHGK